MHLIVGLGNPGKKYEKTRHNVGFMIVDALREELTSYDVGAWELSKKFNAYIAGCTRKSRKLLLAKPTTFMNDSGHAVQLIAHYYKIPPRDILVVHDDKDIPLGEVKVQTDRGHAGHNGIRSIQSCIGTQQFTRYRIGIRSANEKRMQDTAKFVLGKFSLLEKRTLREVIERTTADILNTI